MKNKKNKVIVSVACGAIVGSIGIANLVNSNKNDNISVNEKIKDKEIAENINIENKDENIESITVSEDKEQQIDKIDDENTSDINKSESIDLNVNENNNTSIQNSENVNTGNSAGSSNNTSSSNSINSNNSSDTNVQEPSEEVSNGDNIKDETNNVGGSTDNNGNTSNEPIKYKDGTYEGIARGKEKGLEVRVQVVNGQISSVIVTNHNEMPAFADVAIETIPLKIVQAQSTDVDTISGATYTSKGIIKAVNNALENSI